MNYRFVKPDSLSSFIKLVLKTEDPLFHRIGRVEDFPDIKPAELDCLVFETLKKENLRAIRVKNFMQSDQREKMLERELEGLSSQARELYKGMNEHFENKDMLLQLNDEFSDLMETTRVIRTAFSNSNPWLKTYTRKRDYTDTKEVRRLIDHILVHAAITDEEWLKNPVYPEERKYTKGMKRAKVLCHENKEIQKERSRRINENKREDYIEPDLKILSFELVLRYTEYRNVLPYYWLEGM